ncbi:hypothetical protein GCM10023116_32250 [Kistimonas scapharcae]|uniref:Uncharacterized protein n=1 Tax=Kistimonas scapharcae TaxID=1036133 RepID=A0ABP8V7N0_9GAMM
MGGYLSGRPGSGKPSVEDCINLNVCNLYHKGLLEPGSRTVLKNRRGGSFLFQCRENYFGWPLCVSITWATIGSDKVRTEHNQVIGVEFVDVLNGKARRPYFFCPFTEKRVGVLVMGDRGFGHRTFYGYDYKAQRMGHIDRALNSARKVKEKVGGVNLSGALTDDLLRPKGMHKSTFARYVDQHQRAIAPIVWRVTMVLQLQSIQPMHD